MREFLVEITTNIPEGTDSAEVDRRRAAEAVRENELRERALDTLPLRSWMTLYVTAVEPHPNDPGKADSTA
jgi:muconolactone D-isomerase